MVLKNRINELKTALHAVDRDKLGYINLSSFEEGLKRLRISEVIISDQDIKDLYDKFMIKPIKMEPSKLDYKVFIDAVESSQFEYAKERSNEETQALKRSNSAVGLRTSESIEGLSKGITCHKIPSHLMNPYFKKGKRIGQAIQRFFPTKESFHDYLSKVLEIPKDEIEKHPVDRKGLSGLFNNLFSKFDVTNLRQDDFKCFLSCILYNKNGLTDFKEVQHTLYEYLTLSFILTFLARMRLNFLRRSK